MVSLPNIGTPVNLDLHPKANFLPSTVTNNCSVQVAQNTRRQSENFEFANYNSQSREQLDQPSTSTNTAILPSPNKSNFPNSMLAVHPPSFGGQVKDDIPTTRSSDRLSNFSSQRYRSRSPSSTRIDSGVNGKYDLLRGGESHNPHSYQPRRPGTSETAVRTRNDERDSWNLSPTH